MRLLCHSENAPKPAMSTSVSSVEMMKARFVARTTISRVATMSHGGVSEREASGPAARRVVVRGRRLLARQPGRRGGLGRGHAVTSR